MLEDGSSKYEGNGGRHMSAAPLVPLAFDSLLLRMYSYVVFWAAIFEVLWPEALHPSTKVGTGLTKSRGRTYLYRP